MKGDDKYRMAMLAGQRQKSAPKEEKPKAEKKPKAKKAKEAAE